MSFPTDTHPAVGTQLTIDGTNKGTPAVMTQLGAMTTLADTGVVSIVANGIVGGVARGYAYVSGSGNFQSDRAAQVVAAATLRTGAAAGAEITFTVVPAGSETRIGIDRDEDGAFDRDELDAGSDPARARCPRPATATATAWWTTATTARPSPIRRRPTVMVTASVTPAIPAPTPPRSRS